MKEVQLPKGKVVADTFVERNASIEEIIDAINIMLAKVKCEILAERSADRTNHFVLVKEFSKRKKYGVPDENGAIRVNPRDLVKTILADAEEALRNSQQKEK